MTTFIYGTESLYGRKSYLHRHALHSPTLEGTILLIMCKLKKMFIQTFPLIADKYQIHRLDR